MKKVCIIRSNPADPDSRVEKIAYTLAENGYRVSIFAWDRTADHRVRKDFIKVLGRKVPIYRIGYKASYGEGFKNLKAFLQFQKCMRKWIGKNDYDIIHACDSDTAFFSYGIAKKTAKKFVFDIFDFLYSEPRNLFEWAVYKAQHWLVNNADATIICTEKRKQQIEGSRPKELRIIHNTPMEAMSAVEEGESHGKLRVAYIGILQDYRLLLEIGRYFSMNQEVELHIGGFGKYEGHFRVLSEEHPNIIFYGKIPYEKTLMVEAGSDIMLAIYDPRLSVHKYAAPNKFYEALMLGKPLVMAKGTGMAEIVAENDVGVLIDCSLEGFGRGLEALIGRKGEWPEMSRRMKEIYHEKYSWDVMEERLLDLYGNL